MNERVLRCLYVDAIEHDDFTTSPPAVYELVGINGEERIRYYYITASGERTPFVHKRSHRLRAVIVHEWHRLTGERLASDLEPVETERSES